MTNQQIADHLIGKTPQEIAAICDDVFEKAMNGIPETEHDAIAVELNNVGISVNHEALETATQRGICKRKKSPTN